METIQFFKYQGTGNDFVMIDDRAKTFPIGQALIEKICDRHFGIGADGLILLQNEPNYDFRMVYFNANGTEGSMCGNGGRCTVQFARDLGIVTEAAKFMAVDGEHIANMCDSDIYLKMNDVPTVEQHDEYDFANTGSPHYIEYTYSLEQDDVYSKGHAIRYSDEWAAKGGTNVNFVQILDEKTIAVRTYERGVEDETYSCGTGVTACALSVNLRHGMESPIQIRVLGGELQVSFQKNIKNGFESIYLIGPAVKVFEGVIKG